MARKKKTQMEKEMEKTEGEQGVLIDVEPENAKEILAVARLYKAAETDRMKALQEEVKQKQRIIELIRQNNISPDAKGKTTFRSGKVIITIQPRDELVKISEKKDKKKSVDSA